MTRTIYVVLLAVFCSCTPELPEPEIGSSTYTNLPPVAIAGPDMAITLPDTSYVTLDATNSYDPEKLLLTFNWVQLSGPPTLEFSPHFPKYGAAVVKFVNSGRYQFQLTVKDDRDAVSDTIEIMVKWSADCNSNTEIVSVETQSVGVSPRNISNAPSYALGSDRIVFAGGVLTEPFWPGESANYSSSVHLYDMRSNEWSEWEMLQPKGNMSSVIAGDKLFLGGGSVNDGSITDEVEIHDITTRKITKTKLSAPRIHLSAATAGNKVVFAGGWNNDGSATDLVDIYDLSTNSWTSAKLSEPRTNMATLVNGSKIYFAGGLTDYSGSGISNTVDIFDAVSNSWSVQKLKYSGGSMKTALFGKQMIIAGGVMGQTSHPSNRIEFIDLSDWSSSVDCLLFGPTYQNGPSVAGMNMVVIGDKIYFGGGEFISMYDSMNKLWKYARVENYQRLLFTYKGQLYGFRYTDLAGQGEYQVIRIGL